MQAESIRHGLWGREAAAFTRELEPLTTSLREVLMTDPDKAAALTARLQLLVAEFQDASGEGLTPPMHRFEGVLDRLRRVVYRTEGDMLGMDMTAWEARIEALAQKGQTAWSENDAGAWRRAYNEAQALLETASEQEFSGKRLDDPAYVQRRLANCVAWSNLVERSLLEFVPSNADEIRGLQVAERNRLLASLREKVVQPLEAAGQNSTVASMRQSIDAVSSELERIEHGLERLPQIGLVTERG